MWIYFEGRGDAFPHRMVVEEKREDKAKIFCLSILNVEVQFTQMKKNAGGTDFGWRLKV